MAANRCNAYCNSLSVLTTPAPHSCFTPRHATPHHTTHCVTTGCPGCCLLLHLPTCTGCASRLPRLVRLRALFACLLWPLRRRDGSMTCPPPPWALVRGRLHDLRELLRWHMHKHGAQHTWDREKSEADQHEHAMMASVARCVWGATPHDTYSWEHGSAHAVANTH